MLISESLDFLDKDSSTNVIKAFINICLKIVNGEIFMSINNFPAANSGFAMDKILKDSSYENAFERQDSSFFNLKNTASTGSRLRIESESVMICAKRTQLDIGVIS